MRTPAPQRRMPPVQHIALLELTRLRLSRICARTRCGWVNRSAISPGAGRESRKGPAGLLKPARPNMRDAKELVQKPAIDHQSKAGSGVETCDGTPSAASRAASFSASACFALSTFAPIQRPGVPPRSHRPPSPRDEDDLPRWPPARQIDMNLECGTGIGNALQFSIEGSRGDQAGRAGAGSLCGQERRRGSQVRLCGGRLEARKAVLSPKFGIPAIARDQRPGWSHRTRRPDAAVPCWTWRPAATRHSRSP